MRKRIAIIGTGIAGLTAGHKLHRDHDITIYEANGYVGGHTHTIDVELAGRVWPVDTGFIVFNYQTYPNFTGLIRELGLGAQLSSMSFSVKCERTGLEYNGSSRNALFAQRSNLLRPGFLGMLRDILRFNREAPALLDREDDTLTLGEYLRRARYGRRFIEHYVIPMGAAIWSARPEAMLSFPAGTFVRFFANHGMLTVGPRPAWYVVPGGSREYVRRLIRPFADRIRLDCAVDGVARRPGHVEIMTRKGTSERYDAVVLACHSDQALRLLEDPSAAERSVLGAIPYQENEAILHTDTSVLPRRRIAWAAWNYHLPREARERVAVTYNMNILQNLAAPETFCVTLNYGERIDPRRVIRRIAYHHPVFTAAGIAAQQRRSEVSGPNRTFYCGAYWRYGFHEDGLVSGLQAAQEIEAWSNREQLHLPRAS